MYYRHISHIISLPINKTLTKCQNRPQPPTTAYNRHQSSPITTNHHLPSTHSKCQYCIVSNAAKLNNIRHTRLSALVLLLLVVTVHLSTGQHRHPPNLAFPRFCALSSWSVSCYCVLSSRNIADRRHTLTSIRPNAFILLDTGAAHTTTTNQMKFLLGGVRCHSLLPKYASQGPTT